MVMMVTAGLSGLSLNVLLDLPVYLLRPRKVPRLKILPELLERLIGEFSDPRVMLAYCQSAIIGPAGQRYADDYLFSTEDLSPTRWRSTCGARCVVVRAGSLSRRSVKLGHGGCVHERSHFRQAHGEIALAEFKTLIEKNADYTPAYFMAAQTLAKVDRKPEAIERLKVGIGCAARSG